jgi:hypothetical protein
MVAGLSLQAALPLLLPRAIAWVEEQAQRAASSGRPLIAPEREIARAVGVANPDRVRVALVDALPLPEEPTLRGAALQAGQLGPGMDGLTLGHSILICRGHETPRLLRHELRHVYQYEQAGSIASFLPEYLQQVVQLGYANTAFERDARAPRAPMSNCAL